MKLLTLILSLLLSLFAGGRADTVSEIQSATSLVAAIKGRNQLALGNILGSNVFNILLILGASSVVTPLSFASMTVVDATVLLLSGLRCVLCVFVQ